MTRLALAALIGNIAGDVSILIRFHDLVYSFLLTKRNYKGALKIHNKQSKWDKFALSYIEEHAVFKKEFRFFYKCRLIYIFSVIPPYVIGIILYIFSTTIGAIFASVLFLLKLIIFVLLSTQFYGKTSIYIKTKK